MRGSTGSNRCCQCSQTTRSAKTAAFGMTRVDSAGRSWWLLQLCPAELSVVMMDLPGAFVRLQAGFDTPRQASNSPRHRTVVAQKPLTA